MVLNGGVSSSVAWAGRGSELGRGWPATAEEWQRLAHGGGRAAAQRKPLSGLRFGPSFVTSPAPPSDLTTPAEVSPDPKELRQIQTREHPCFHLFQNSCELQGTQRCAVETASQHFPDSKGDRVQRSTV